MKTFKLNSINFEQKGRKISYNYVIDKQISKYFNKANLYYVLYDQDVSSTPQSIAVIPLLANIMPLSWFIGFDVYIDEIDETFNESLKILKKQFIKFYPDKDIKGELIINKIVNNKLTKNNSSLLFSGGVDSLLRNIDKNPYLISVHGADVTIDDNVRWNEFKRFNNEEEILKTLKLFYIESNLREFYTYKVELLVEIGWWGTVQHGMALVGILAPLSYKYNITDINIASSATAEVNYNWGSSPLIDENMKWANSLVTHEGYHLRRTDKVDNIIDFVTNSGYNIKLRVCYADERSGYNCNVCHKCQRTALSIILHGANPRDYGLNIPDNFYDLIFDNFGEDCVMTKGIKYQWSCIQDKGKKSNNFFVLKNKEKEEIYIRSFTNLNLDEIVNKNKSKVDRSRKRKFLLRQNFPFLYKFYTKIIK